MSESVGRGINIRSVLQSALKKSITANMCGLGAVPFKDNKVFSRKIAF